jgi:protein ImuB
MFACLFRPPPHDPLCALAALAEEFSPRYERHDDGLVSIDVSGLERLIGPPRTIGEELQREAAVRGAARLHVALAATRTSAAIAALARPGLTVIPPGGEGETLASLPISVIDNVIASGLRADGLGLALSSVLARWGIRTLGELAALPSADLAARLGAPARMWQAVARGEEVWPLVPTRPEERFDAFFDLEWPVEGLEPLSFVLTRLLEPLSTRLERRDRGAAVLHVQLRLVSAASGAPREICARRLELPTPMRDVRTLRTLALLDLEAHPPSAAVDRVTIVIDPTPSRVLQHTLFTRAHPTPEQLSTLLARLGALIGQDRVGRAVVLDTDRPDAFAMSAFATERSAVGSRQSAVGSQATVVSALRRCRHPIPARVAVDRDRRPVRVTTDRRGYAGGSVVHCAGPWRTSGEWWNVSDGSARGHASARTTDPSASISVSTRRGWGPAGSEEKLATSWDRDEWDVALTDGAMYRIFQDRDSGGWFIEAVFD